MIKDFRNKQVIVDKSKLNKCRCDCSAIFNI